MKDEHGDDADAVEDADDIEDMEEDMDMDEEHIHNHRTLEYSAPREYKRRLKA